MKKQFKINWMSCASCISLNEKFLKEKKWIENIAINLATSKASIDYNEKIVSFKQIKKIIEKNGFSVSENDNEESYTNKNNKFFNNFLFSLIFSLPILLGMFINTSTWIKILQIDLSLIIFFILSIIVVFILWWHFHKNAFKSLLRFNFNMDSLVSLWTLTAFFYSIFAINFQGMPVYFEAAVAIITFINLWRYLEYKAKTKAWDAIGKLIKLWTKEANLLVWKEIVKKNVEKIKVWDILVVKPWEKIPLDGIIIKGTSNIDESMLTWESIPVFKKLDNNCFGWTLNLDWNINIKVTKTNKDWTLSHIIDLINNAQISKAPIQKLADKISWIFVPIIIIISIITFISWYIITWNLPTSISAAVATLVIACPCALWLATPTAIMVWTWVWAREWILIKNAETLEKTKNIDYVIFDKTGTLTNGTPEITDLITLWNNEELLVKYAKSLSVLSNHPLSKPIAKYKEKIKPLEVKRFKEIKWKWIVREIKWDIIYLWNKSLLKDIKINKNVKDKIYNLSKHWKTPILIWKGNNIIWILGLLDSPKIWVEIIIRELRYRNIEVIMTTWDINDTAKYIAKQVWIKKVYSEILPKDKLKIVKEIQSKWFKVAFVWDWINDAPALVQSDLWIAMWTWSDIAIDSSDIVLVKGDLYKVVSSISLSRRTLKAIKQNLFWAFIYNIIWIPLATFWILNPVLASLAMSMSSVSVLLNSLRIRKFKWFKNIRN